MVAAQILTASLFPIYQFLTCFSRYDVYLGIVCNYTDINYEKAATLYNYGAIHSILGSQESRGSSEGMKVACTHFQCAAWAFHTLPDRYPAHAGADLSTDLLAFLSQVRPLRLILAIASQKFMTHTYLFVRTYKPRSENS